MAWIEKRAQPGKNGEPGTTSWRVVFRDARGVKRSQSFPTERAARDFAKQAEVDLARGDLTDPAGPRTLFGDYYNRWRAGRVHRSNTQDQVEMIFRVRVLPTLGHRQLGQIRPSDIQAWVAQLAGAGYSPATIETSFAWLRSVFAAAVHDELIRTTPCRRIRLPKKPPAQLLVPITAGQVQDLADAIHPQLRGLVITGAGTGLRSGELGGLDLTRVDMLHRRLTVNRQLLTPQNGSLFFGPPKSEASNREVPLAAVVVEELAAHLAQWPAQANDAGVIFTPPRTTRLLSRKTLHWWWRKARLEVGLPDVTPHDLRHFYASTLLAAGESLLVVKARLGHASIQETADTYGHLVPGDDDRTRRTIDLALGSRSAVG
ncbi:MAG: tyrosine-type recombinase/integrase [Acidimicrobiales bacterium]